MAFNRVYFVDLKLRTQEINTQQFRAHERVIPISYFLHFIGYYGYLYLSVVLARCITEIRCMLFFYFGKNAGGCWHRQSMLIGSRSEMFHYLRIFSFVMGSCVCTCK